MSSIDNLLAQTTASNEVSQANIVAAVRRLSTNKDIRIFLTALCRYSKADWASFIRTCKLVYQVMQSSIMVKEDSKLLDEIVKTPHIAMFFRRLTEEDV
jgi:hypothetical protein